MYMFSSGQYCVHFVRGKYVSLPVHWSHVLWRRTSLKKMQTETFSYPKSPKFDQTAAGMTDDRVFL